MKRTVTFIAALLLAPLAWLHAAEIILAEPLDYQVFQRLSLTAGEVHIRGTLAHADAAKATLETARSRRNPYREKCAT